MTEPPLRVLLVEDDPEDHLITRRLLARVPGVDAEGMRWARSLDEGLAALDAERFDVILLDFHLGADTGLEFLRRAQSRGVSAPVIVLTGLADGAADGEAMRAGAADFLSKAAVDAEQLGRTIRRSIDRQKAYEARAHLSAIVETSSDAMYIVGMDGTIHTWNPAAERIFGYTADEVVGQSVELLLPPEMREDAARIRARIAAGERLEGFETTRQRRDGAFIHVSISGAPIRDADGGIRRASVVARDVTEQRRLEDHVRQSQRLEALGRLAGGIAHDFNNLLTAIGGTADLILAELAPADPLREDVAEIKRAGDRAAALTRQLLAFSRQQVLQVRVFDLNSVVASADRLLRRLIGADVQLVTLLSTEPASVRADAGQVEQVLTNLALNARDAMPGGGRLLIETRSVMVGGGPGEWPVDAPRGPYVLLSVSDDGTGISPAVLPRIFEPFFTTKEQGKGTGLGLSTVHGIVTQNGGYLAVHTAEGEGTTFQVFLPAAEGKARAEPDGEVHAPLPRGSETVLLVDDEVPVRTLARRILQRQGYTVLEAENGEEGLQAWREGRGTIAAVVTDMVMPLMGGREMVRRIRQLAPGLPVAFMSGYSQDAMDVQGRPAPRTAFLGKPFRPDELARAVRALLDAQE